ncbi:MAG: hypothetical protein IT328_09585 [Caldilineaceae bacterium]|nr:hypothetical protein [Caldilineaceae bacterium]
MSDLNRQIQNEGSDWLQITLGVALFVALVLAATFCHAKVSHAQETDPMPRLYVEYRLPLITNEVTP